MELYNTKATETIVQNEKSLTRVIVNSNFTYELTDVTSLRNIFIFKGKQNDLELSHVLETYFICRYNMALYPFDTQTCSLDFLLIAVSDDFCFLESGVLKYTGPTDLTQYFIKHTYMKNDKIDGRSGVRVFVILGRRLLSNALTVYLPTVLLNLIGHLTTYFKPYFFEVCMFSASLNTNSRTNFRRSSL